MNLTVEASGLYTSESLMDKTSGEEVGGEVSESGSESVDVKSDY